MKNYKQILEAINRGIKFALDDFEDNDNIQGQINSKVKYKGGIKEYLELMEKVVDLGLPSGTLWCKYNLGVDDSKELKHIYQWYGDYYAWGETATKSYYSWDNYKFGSIEDNLSKYNKNDRLTQLLPIDDVATQKLDNNFYIPTVKQFEELFKYTTFTDYTKEDGEAYLNIKDNFGNGLYGRLFISKINGNKIFFPFAGWSSSFNNNKHSKFPSITNKQEEGSYWTSILENDRNNVCKKAYCISFGMTADSIEGVNRNYGLSIRPVINL